MVLIAMIVMMVVVVVVLCAAVGGKHFGEVLVVFVSSGSRSIICLSSVHSYIRTATSSPTDIRSYNSPDSVVA